ncbi:MAG: YggS family pyridoxal phosphate-dependent enzyme [Acetobacteraceae bacterium]|nr:YggS family pyridoxal phosphate-dependent enzyme [Acetobacteraceae bacterium]
MDHLVERNLAQIRDRIANAAIRAGRNPRDVTLVAVTKTQPLSSVMAALRAGQIDFGENRVQEAVTKFAPLRAGLQQPLRLHIIGGLQTNKARDAARIAEVIETLDRPRLADALVAAIDKEGRTPELLVQVNVGDEPQKSGVPRTQADPFIEDCKSRFGPALRGLMCIPPEGADPGPHFAWLAECAARHGLLELSMGMSADFETAIAYGATCVRIGTAIFGERDPLLRLHRANRLQSG